MVQTYGWRMAVVGAGLIGGSMGLGLRAAGAAASIAGFDVDPESAKAALARGALTSVAGSPGEAVAGADIVVLALPVDRIAGMCRALAELVPAEAVVTDVGSAKGPVVVEGERIFAGRFVGGHPMAGSERHGVAAADGRLFHGAPWVLTPTSRTSPAAYATITALVQSLGARPVALEPDVHDALVARLSHVPQLTASALVETAAGAGDRDALLGLAGGGFRDATRIAASNPDLWVAIIRTNRAAVLDALEAVGDRLEHLRALVHEGRWDALGAFLARARRARLELFAKPDVAGPPITLAMMVPDRPGVLAEVTTAAGQLGANIEDLRIVHSTEGGGGRLELVVAGEEAAEALAEALTARGYTPWREEVDPSTSS